MLSSPILFAKSDIEDEETEDENSKEDESEDEKTDVENSKEDESEDEKTDDENSKEDESEDEKTDDIKTEDGLTPKPKLWIVKELNLCSATNINNYIYN